MRGKAISKNGNGYDNNGTVVTLKTFIDARFDAQDKVFDIKLEELKTALKNFEHEFKIYKEDLAGQATAAALATGTRLGMNRIGSLGVAIIGVLATMLWAASMAVNIYIALHK